MKKEFSLTQIGIILAGALCVIDLIAKCIAGYASVFPFLLLFHLSAILFAAAAWFSGRRAWQIGMAVEYLLLAALHQFLYRETRQTVFYLIMFVIALAFVIVTMVKGKKQEPVMNLKKRLLIYLAVGVVYAAMFAIMSTVNFGALHTASIGLKKSESVPSGTIVTVEYDSYEYSLDGEPLVPMSKYCRVYLPYGYDESREYNVLYLLHGAGGSADAWFNAKGVTDILDTMIASGEIEPLIVVTPTQYLYNDQSYTNEEIQRTAAETGYSNYYITTVFQYELRNDLIPAIEGTYSTYASGDVSEESLRASRNHRAVAGYSMGGSTTLRSAMDGCIDLFSWFGNFSGGTRVDADEIAASITSAQESGYSIDLYYNTVGTTDQDFYTTQGLYNKLLKSGCLTAGDNTMITILPYKDHSFSGWRIALYNSLKLFFSE